MRRTSEELKLNPADVIIIESYENKFRNWCSATKILSTF